MSTPPNTTPGSPSGEPTPHAPAACPKLKPLTDYLASLAGPPDLAMLERLLDDLHITRDDLADHVKFSDYTYQRNRVAASGWYELLIVCWKPGQASHIHDHAGSACAFKVIEGTGSETTYERLDSGYVRPVAATILEQGHVCASVDADIHYVANDTDDHDLITLHLYAPALKLMSTYEAEPGSEDARKRLVEQAAAAD